MQYRYRHIDKTFLHIAYKFKMNNNTKCKSIELFVTNKVKQKINICIHKHMQLSGLVKINCLRHKPHSQWTLASVRWPGLWLWQFRICRQWEEEDDPDHVQRMKCVHASISALSCNTHSCKCWSTSFHVQVGVFFFFYFCK